ncbi:MAG: tetratricopeptide repeat protein, partial [Bacteroidales bacterium]|nr:tetratricopeptide repeat protein [Bacteroidales bacterium]
MSKNLSNNILNKLKFILPIIIILVITFISYSPVLNNSLTNYDDHRYILENHYIKQISLKSVFNTFNIYFDGHYHPLTLISLSIDHYFGNTNAFQYHLTNIILHLINTLLVFWFVYLLVKRKNIALFVSLLFGINTMGVESVAWISERKNLLFTLFYLAALISYLKYLDKKKILSIFYVLIFFLLSVLSKAQAITLPITLLAIDWLYKRNLLSKKVILEKAPFLAISIFFGIIANLAQQAFWTKMGESTYSFFERIIFSSQAFSQYIFKLLIPIKLSAFYPYPVEVGQSIPFLNYLFILIVIIVIVLLIITIKRSRITAFAILFFIINIFFVLKLFNVPFGNYYMADRYSYLPSIGLFLIIGYFFIEISKKKAVYKIPLYLIFLAYFVFLGSSTFSRTKVWKNSISLWTNVIEQYPKATHAWNDRGNAKSNSGDIKGAIMDFNKAIQLNPENAIVYNNRGNANGKSGKFSKAINDFNKAIELSPEYADALSNRALAYSELGKYNLAFNDINKAIKLKPQFAVAINNRGNIYRKIGNPVKAIQNFKKAIKINPTFAQAYANKGNAEFELDNFEQAIKDFDKAVDLGLKISSIYFRRGFAKCNKLAIKEAINDFNLSINLDPTQTEAYFYRGFARYKSKQFREAIDDLDISIKRNPDFALSYAIRGLSKINIGMNESACEDF